MKKILVITLLLLSWIVVQKATAQLRVGLNLNVGIQPQWGPDGYDHVSYYYIPDIDVFYNVASQQYIYEEGGRWVFAPSLPNRYDNYDLYRGYKVVVNAKTPYRRANTYRVKYARYKDNHQQHIIRDSHDSRYFSNVNHPQHEQWEREQKQKKGNNHEKENHPGNGNNKGGDREHKNGGKGKH
ncbi:hypothetical protein [Arcicella rigui]|uniref:Uncharacterized protein n=1 Tax=Arcicella rigui TaxID=797020 RepID=A0ABU5Q8P5_9BACT|nr:hypothetical protein [Arcicella rigui]MEA5139118.1 hypothetical protein [Arcicella rigui]